MTKADEIALLTRVIKRFGPNSYLGPWLAEIQDSIVADITNDVTPDAPLPRAARVEARLILEHAKVTAAKTVKDAEDYAAGMRSGAVQSAAQIRSDAKRHLIALAERL